MKYQKAKSMLHQASVANDKLLSLKEREKEADDLLRSHESGPTKLRERCAAIKERLAQLEEERCALATEKAQLEKQLGNVPEELRVARMTVAIARQQVESQEKLVARFKPEELNEARKVCDDFNAKEAARKLEEESERQRDEHLKATLTPDDYKAHVEKQAAEKRMKRREAAGKVYPKSPDRYTTLGNKVLPSRSLADAARSQ